MPKRPDNPITFIGRTDFRGERRMFAIRRADRRAHVYVIGKTGVGKSTLLETMVRQDISREHGFALFDPHGDLVERIAACIPDETRKRLVYFNVPDDTAALAFNPLEPVPPAKRPLAASGLLEAFKKIWHDSWGPRMEYILRNALLVLLEQEEATLADVLRLLDDAGYRKEAAARVFNPRLRDFWLREYEKYPARFRQEAIAPIQNKVGVFLADPRLYRIFTAERSFFDLRQLMDTGGILLVNLAKGRIGEDTAALLGALLVSRIGLVGLSRSDVPETKRRDFAVYLDEFQSFTTLALAGMLSELRKYRVGLVLAHQYLSQLDLQVRDAVLGNVGTVISFRLGPEDARVLERVFQPTVTETDLGALPNHRFYIKLMVQGAVSPPFSGETFGPIS